jgi:hypothetical protein
VVLGYATVRGLAELGLGPVVQVAGDVAVTLAVYGAASVVSRTVRHDITDIIEIVRLLRRRRGAAA